MEDRGNVMNTKIIACEWAREHEDQFQIKAPPPKAVWTSYSSNRRFKKGDDDKLLGDVIGVAQEMNFPSMRTMQGRILSDGASRRMMIESIDDEQMGSMKIASYGDIVHRSLDMES